jgi:predicted transcriptional regulator of viral defense system
MKTLEKIRNNLKNKQFSMKEAIELGITRYALTKLDAEGKIEKIGHGLYTLRTGNLTHEEQFKRATFKIGEPSLICLLSALEYYDLTVLVTKEVCFPG